MNNVIKLLGAAAICTVMFKACTMEYASQLVDDIPTQVYQQISSQNPNWSPTEIAGYYYQYEDSIRNEYEMEAQYISEYAEYKNCHPEEFVETNEDVDEMWEKYCDEFKINKDHASDEDINFYLDVWLESQNY